MPAKLGFLGGSVGATAAAVSALIAWIVLPLAAAIQLIRVRDQ